jgi:aldose 1-epimerase
VHRPRLEAGTAVVVLDPASGGRIASLAVDSFELLVTQGRGPLDWGLYPMVPFAGRIRNGRFTFNGRDYQLPINLPPNAIHGTLLERAWSIDDDGDSTMTAELTEPWPFAGRVRQTVDLQPDALRVTLEVDADEPMPVTVGWHPWWRGPVELTFDAAAMYERDSDGIPTGRRTSPPAGPWDDCFVLTGSPVMRWPNGLTVTCESTADHWVVFTEPSHAICVEPQTGPPDAVNLGLAAVADPGRPVVAEATWRWSYGDG